METAFPACAIYRLADYYVEADAELVDLVKSGWVFREACGERIRSGSKAEGLALESQWGHPDSDSDVMLLLGGEFGVHVPQDQQPPDDVNLQYSTDGCPPAYCKLLVNDTRVFHESLTDTSGGRWWLRTAELMKQLQFTENSVQADHPDFQIVAISGPAGQAACGYGECVPALVSNAPHPSLTEEFQHRTPREWPSTQTIEELLQLPMLMVLVGSKNSSDCDHQARLSWSLAEMKLISELPAVVKQGHISCKYALKPPLSGDGNQNDTGGGRSRVGSYHLKTVLLWVLERKAPSKITSPFELMLDILNELDHYLKVGSLPHYFLPQCNLLATVRPSERHSARQAIQTV